MQKIITVDLRCFFRKNWKNMFVDHTAYFYRSDKKNYRASMWAALVAEVFLKNFFHFLRMR